MTTPNWVNDPWRTRDGTIHGATWVNYAPVFKWVDSKLDTINITKEQLNNYYNLKWTKSNDFDGVYLIYAKIGLGPWEEVDEDIVGREYHNIKYDVLLEAVFENHPIVPAATVAFTMNVTDGIDTVKIDDVCLLYTSPSPRDKRQSRMPSSA